MKDWDILILKWGLVFFVCLMMKSISAQDSLAIQYSLNARGTFKEGQLNQTILSIDGNYILSAQYWETDFFTNYKYLKTNGRVGENELFSRILISILPKQRVFPVLGYIYYKSEFYQIQRRHTPGLGIGWRLLENQSSNIRLNAWLAYDDTGFKTISGYNTLRINAFAVGNHKLIPEKLSLQYTLYLLQSIEERNNYIWRVEPTILFHISNKFSLTINLESHYENIIVPNNTNRNTAMTVGLKFQNK
ncbi:MAG: DUF481 domain-containing protein [Bacteroidota bacterium]